MNQIDLEQFERKLNSQGVIYRDQTIALLAELKATRARLQAAEAKIKLAQDQIAFELEHCKKVSKLEYVLVALQKIVATPEAQSE